LESELRDKKLELSNTTDPGIFKTEFEKNLYKKINELRKYFQNINKDEDFDLSINNLAESKKIIFDFFDNVIVNEDDFTIKKNRLELIQMLCKTFDYYVNFFFNRFPPMKKLILNFKSKDSKKIKNPKNFLGGKGANLSEMGRMGLPVPPGFTISTKVCELFYKDKKKLNKSLVTQIKKELKIIEKDVGKKFGDLKNPLLLSVRSGARVSMPGMMDTILNLGLNDKTVSALSFKNFKWKIC
jgi:hypothetical protein